MADINTNLTNFGFFDYQEGDTGDTYAYTSDEFCNFINSICPDGVMINYGNKFGLTNSGNIITVGTGLGIVSGHWGYLTSSTTFTLTTSQPYTLSLACDTVGRNVNLHLHEGSTAPSGEVLLYNLTWNGTTLTKVDNRTNVYLYPNVGNAATVSIIYSASEPTYVQNAIWLKPVEI